MAALFFEKQCNVVKFCTTVFSLSAPCSAGDYMTGDGCVECLENTYSGDGASSCISCPENMISPAGSTSVDQCNYGW